MVNNNYTTSLLRVTRATLFLCAFLFAGNSLAESDDVESVLPLQLGDYLTAEYIDLLCQTRSPIAAGKKSDHRQYIRVNFNVKRKYIGFTLMGNFHEGLGGIVTDTSLYILSDDFGEKSPVRLNVLSRSEYAIKVKGKTLIYRYVGNYKQFVARNTIAGKYKDEKGAVYAFTEEGVATFPDRSFRYAVDADFVMINFDTFFEVLPHAPFVGVQYGFKFINNKLQVFEMGGPMGNEPEAKPFVTLTRIGDAEAKP